MKRGLRRMKRSWGFVSHFSCMKMAERSAFAKAYAVAPQALWRDKPA